jgi:hypothetical protein
MNNKIDLESWVKNGIPNDIKEILSMTVKNALSEDQINLIWFENFDIKKPEWLVKFARILEQAHGINIKGEPYEKENNA